MYLTKEEEKMLEGEYGVLHEWALRFLTAYGDALKAERLIDINSAYIDWYEIEVILPPDVYNAFLQAKMAVPTYNMALHDAEFWKEASPERFQPVVWYPPYLDKLARNMHITLAGTCTPYLVGWIPARGTHVASIESSCWSYINSVFGARTHKESFPGILATAVTGKTPYAGLHTDEGRKGNLLVKVETELTNSTDYYALGYHVGNIPTCEIPVFTGIQNLETEQLKSLGAALNTSGSVGLYHIVGLTPEAPTIEAPFAGEKPHEKIAVGEQEIRNAYDSLCTYGPEKVDYVILGCPHYTIKQLETAAGLLNGKKVHRNVTLWIYVPPAARQIATRMGITDIIKDAGGALSTECFEITFNSLRTPLDGEVIATDSAKCAHYAPALYPVDAWFGSVEDCVKAAITGRWGRN